MLSVDRDPLRLLKRAAIVAVPLNIAMIFLGRGMCEPTCAGNSLLTVPYRIALFPAEQFLDWTTDDPPPLASGALLLGLFVGLIVYAIPVVVIVEMLRERFGKAAPRAAEPGLTREQILAMRQERDLSDLH